MIWYLLSPIRGTTQPPRLSANHPVRRAFYRHGKTTAQHWLVAMLVSVSIAIVFCYPTVFLSENPTAGFAAYPTKVWTAAKPVDGGTTNVDVEMRQIWVHGSYMNALDKSVLKRALAIQESLVGDEKPTSATPTSEDELRFSALQWGYHSPLMYWNNSAETIDADQDILKTINAQRHSSSSLNVILRPASVFAGKKFSRYQLLAADALVITLMNKAGDSVGTVWQDRMQKLNSETCSNCTLFPRNGRATQNRVYEFSFTPLSTQEHIALTFAYGLMALYVLLSLRRMKAFHSRFGLVVTAITQMTWSILASFTICGILKINLSMIPQNAYPFIVLVLGVENMFRLINAILAYPPTMATDLRIANALGDVGPISVAAAAQNLTILSLLSTVVSPGVAAFCAFAAIASLFDAFFLLTFFVAVLNVDIKRLELQDALAARHNQTRHRRRASPLHHAWFDALIKGRLPFSTRMAGTAVTTTFIFSLNYHFFERKDKSTSIRHVLEFVRGGPPTVGDFELFAAPPMNASLTPGEWIRMQDLDTAKEVMRLAKPGADSFVVRLFTPLVVVLGGSDRTGVARGREEWTQALRSLAVHHLYPVAVLIVFAVTFVAVLMNFLLYNEAGDEENDIALEQEEDSIAAETIGLPHRLDIVKMASSCNNSHLVTISLDRTIAVSTSTVDPSRQTFHTSVLPNNALSQVSWPIHNAAVDDDAEWIACHCANDSVMAYSCSTGSLIQTLVQYPDDHPAILFQFTSLPATGGSRLYFVVLTSAGRLAMSCLDDSVSSGVDLSTTTLLGAALLDTNAHGRQLIVTTEDGVIISHTWASGNWIANNTRKLQLPLDQGKLTGSVRLQLYSDLDAEVVIVMASETVLFLDAATLAHVASFRTGEVGTHLENILLRPSRKCSACGSLALRKIAASIKSAEGVCTLTTWSVDEDDTEATDTQEADPCMCLVPASPSCRTFESATKEEHVMSNAGVWTTLRPNAILGLRKRKQEVKDKSSDIARPTISQIKQRRHARQHAQSDETIDDWQAYKLSIDGDLSVLDVPADAEGITGQDTALYVNSPGPVVILDPQSIAVAFGNTVKVIRASKRCPVIRRAAATASEPQSSTSRRLTARKGR